MADLPLWSLLPFSLYANRLVNRSAGQQTRPNRFVLENGQFVFFSHSLFCRRFGKWMTHREKLRDAKIESRYGQGTEKWQRNVCVRIRKPYSRGSVAWKMFVSRMIWHNRCDERMWYQTANLSQQLFSQCARHFDYLLDFLESKRDKRTEQARMHTFTRFVCTTPFPPVFTRSPSRSSECSWSERRWCARALTHSDYVNSEIQIDLHDFIDMQIKASTKLD